MADYPPKIVKAARDARDAHPDDIPAAVAEAEAAIRKMPEFASLVEKLITHSIRELVYSARHEWNENFKKDNGFYSTNKSRPIEGCVNEAYASVYLYKVGGSILGKLTGEDALRIATSELTIANGHLFNHRLLSFLGGVVPAEKRVEEVLSEKKLKKEFDRIRNEMNFG